MRRILAILVFAALLVPIAHSCQWTERVDAYVLSQNNRPIAGATLKITHQRNAILIPDYTTTFQSDASGFARYSICDNAPQNITYDYNITVTEPYYGQVKFLSQSYDPARNGTNQLYFVYLFDLYNLTINVTDRSGLQVAGTQVNITGTRSKSLVTDSNGSAWVILPPGDYQATAGFEDGAVSKPALGLNWDRSVSIAQPPLTNNTLVVSLASETGAPLENITVLLDVGEESPREAASNSTGAAAFSEIRVFSGRLDLRKDNVTLYSARVQLSNFTALNISLDLNPPTVGNISASYRNIGDAANDVYRVTVSANVSDAGGYGGLAAELDYRIGEGNFTSMDMARSGGLFAAAPAFQNLDAPFNFTYYVNATDSSGNWHASDPATLRVEPVPPEVLATPTPVPSPGGTGTEWLDELLASTLGPVAGALESVSTYMWILIILVFVILGGTVFVFAAVNAFFYMKTRKKPKR